jgi:Lar family restriction alleviation protein
VTESTPMTQVSNLPEELKACPFCGDDEELRVCQPPHMHGYWVVHCGCCGGEMQAESEAGAIAGWNERASTIPAQDALVGALRGVRGFLDLLTKQGEDNIWRPAERHLKAIDAALAKLPAPPVVVEGGRS